MFVKSYIIVMTGIGGQGLITLLQILGNTLMNAGYKVITSETHGLSQRGGKVLCFLRFGNNLGSPIPIIGSADMIIAIEKNFITDTLKFAKLDRSTKLVIFNYEGPLLKTKNNVNKSLINNLYELFEDIYYISPSKITKSLINVKSINMFLLGYILRFLPLNENQVEKSINQKFSGNKLTLSIKALKEGQKLELFKIFKKD